MTATEGSLLAFLDAPVLVGDPGGLTVYVNPAFEERFGVSLEKARGVPLAQLFEGGGREAVLHAVVSVCREWQSVRFRLRDGALGYAAVASPIIAEDESVGVLILLTEVVDSVERLLRLQRMLEEAIAELEGSVQVQSDPGARLDAAAIGRLVQRVRQWSDALRCELRGRPDLRTH